MIRWSRIVSLVALVAALFVLIGATVQDVTDDVILGLDLQGGFEVLYEAHPMDESQEINKDVLLDTVEAINRRVDGVGVKNMQIQIEGNDRIRVQLAGVQDPEQAREMIGKPARLEFRAPDEETVLMTGQNLQEGGASAELSQYNQPIVTLSMKDAQKFADITEKYVGQRIGIYLDEERLSAPEIQTVIAGGDVMIEGVGSMERAKELATLLNAGSLPVDLEEIYANSVGAKLGQMALDKSIFAGYIGIGLILLYMLFFYRILGVLADITLVAYMFFILVVFTWLNATLTLPGIAAFVLGVGMAVDANIITLERIKEELRSGKTILSSVRAGSRRSLGTILDANITTIIAAAVLFYFGTTAVQGFAIMLILSIVVSLITAVFGARLMMSLLIRSRLVNKPSYFGVKEGEISEL